MKRIDDDAFYEYIKQYDPDSEYHSVGEVDYHLLSDDKPYENPPERRVLCLIMNAPSDSFHQACACVPRFADLLTGHIIPVLELVKDQCM